MLESELGEDAQSISERYHVAARQLSVNIPAGRGALAQVQQLFLTACWYTSEASWKDSWAALCAAVHEAQEIGTSSPAKAFRASLL